MEENVKTIQVTKDVLALKYLSVALERDVNVVGNVLAAMESKDTAYLIETLMGEELNETTLQEARELFYSMENKMSNDVHNEAEGN